MVVQLCSNWSISIVFQIVSHHFMGKVNFFTYKSIVFNHMGNFV